MQWGYGFKRVEKQFFFKPQKKQTKVQQLSWITTTFQSTDNEKHVEKG